MHRMQALVSRETSPLGTAVVSVTKQAAGEGAYNVIPASASFGSAIRSLSHDYLMHLKRRTNEVRSGFEVLQGDFFAQPPLSSFLPRYKANDVQSVQVSSEIDGL